MGCEPIHRVHLSIDALRKIWHQLSTYLMSRWTDLCGTCVPYNADLIEVSMVRLLPEQTLPLVVHTPKTEHSCIDMIILLTLLFFFDEMH